MRIFQQPVFWINDARASVSFPSFLKPLRSLEIDLQSQSADPCKSLNQRLPVTTCHTHFVYLDFVPDFSIEDSSGSESGGLLEVAEMHRSAQRCDGERRPETGCDRWRLQREALGPKKASSAEASNLRESSDVKWKTGDSGDAVWMIWMLWMLWMLWILWMFCYGYGL